MATKKTDVKLLDPTYRIKNLYKIVNKDGKLVKFVPNEHQWLVLQDPSLLKAILKARQIGFSTACIIQMLDRTLFNKNQTSVILAHEQDSITKLFRIVLRAYKYMDDEIKPKLERGGGAKHELYFPSINSRIYCDLESRGDTIQNLHISEFGLMKDDEKVKATLDAVPMRTGRITYESTAFGLNHFYDLWFARDRAEKKFFFPWFVFPEYALPTKKITDYSEEEDDLIVKAALHFKIKISDEQIAFRRWKIAQKGGGTNGERHFIQEYPEDEQSCFLTSGNAVFNLFHIRKLLNNAPKHLETLDGGIKIFKRPDKTRTYVCGGDCAEGVGGDKSYGVMLDARSREVVATVCADVKPYEFAELLNKMCIHYRAPGRPFPMLAVERNNHGHAVLLQLEEHIRYSNLFFRIKSVDPISGRQQKDDRPGWVTDKVTRPIMINAFVDAVENSYMTLNDSYILNECLTLVNNEGKIEAAENKNDDSIIASSIALQLAIEMGGNLVRYDDLKSKIKM
jgi:hypothetical protein